MEDLLEVMVRSVELRSIIQAPKRVIERGSQAVQALTGALGETHKFCLRVLRLYLSLQLGPERCDKIADVKDRLTRIESNSIGHKEGMSSTMALVSVGVTLVGLLFGYGIFHNVVPTPIVAVVPSAVDTQQNSQIAALTRLLEQHLTPVPAK